MRLDGIEQVEVRSSERREIILALWLTSRDV
jgi:hypothetical protein